MKFKSITEMVLISAFLGIGIGIMTGHLENASEPPVVEQHESLFDVSIIEDNWCGQGSDGTVRMVGAWMVKDDNGLMTLEDETGALWEVTDVLIHENDYLLLWIADCGTSDDLTDDLILKCWAEVH